MSDKQTFKAMFTQAGIQFKELDYDGARYVPYRHSDFSPPEGTTVVAIDAEETENVSGTAAAYYFDDQEKLFHISYWPY